MRRDACWLGDAEQCSQRPDAVTGPLQHRSAPRLPIETVAAGGGPLTITDANLLLGRLQVQRFPAVFGASADLPPNVEVVRRAFADLAEALGQTPERVAAGGLQLAVEPMAAAIRLVSLHWGQDIRGGVLLHPMAGVLSAFGMGQARQRCRKQPHLGAPLSPALLAGLPHQVEVLAHEAQEVLRRQGDIDAITVLVGGGSTSSFVLKIFVLTMILATW